jgi:opacity protein-like surface antigen
MSRVSTLKLAACAAVIAIVCASAAPAGAQNSYGKSGGKSTELTIFNGYYIASDLYDVSGNAVSNGVKIGLENSYMWGAKLGINPNDRMGVELAYTRIGSNVKSSANLPSLGNQSDLGRINGNAYDLNFLFYQPPDIKPAAGKTIDSKSLFNWNFGVGTKVALNEKLDLRLEGRWRVTDTAITTSAGVYCDYWGYCYSYASDWYSAGELTAGLTYKLPSR